MLATDQRRDLEADLSQRGIRWTPLAYRSGGARAAASNALRMFKAAWRATRGGQRACVVHARSYVPAALAFVVCSMRRTRYIFDMRGYWIDERRDEQGRFESAPVFATAKIFERILLRRALAIVSLSETAAKDIQGGMFGRDAAKVPVAVIPTCADYDLFPLRKRVTDGAVPSNVQERLLGRLVIGHVGSLNQSYYNEESIVLFALIREFCPSAHFLGLTHQVGQLEELLRRRGIPEHAYTVRAIRHAEVADWISWMDWAFMLLRSPFAKRASMPTKLAEFLAAGVRLVQYGCNDDVRRWVEVAGTGYILSDLSPLSLKRCAEHIAGSPMSMDDLWRARERTREHFDLSSGCSKYLELLKDVGVLA